MYRFLVAVAMVLASAYSGVAHAGLLVGGHARVNSITQGTTIYEAAGFVRKFDQSSYSGPYAELKVGEFTLRNLTLGVANDSHAYMGLTVGFKSPGEHPWRKLDGAVMFDYSPNVRRIGADVVVGYDRAFLSTGYRRTITVNHIPRDYTYSEGVSRVGLWCNDNLAVYAVARSMSFGFGPSVAQTTRPLFPFGAGITVIMSPLIIQGITVYQRTQTLTHTQDEVNGWLMLTYAIDLGR